MQATHLTPKTRRLALSAVLSLLLLESGFAQTTPPAQTTAPSQTDETKPAGDETITLSPFVVDASQDQGYRATNTLAGSRINTPLKDVAAPITVVTKEFLNDLSAIGINDVLAYTANTEGARDYTSTTSSLGRPTDDIASNPYTANRIRGLATADITRDYFYTIGTWVGFDAYDLDEVTISRGPNSILAGLGSPGGIIDYSPQMAALNVNKNLVSYRFGSYGDQRAIINSNVVALKDVLAFRVAAVWNDRGFKQSPAYNKDERYYLAGTYRPWKKTTIRASYESVKIKANNPNTLTPEDDVSQWVSNGKPIYDSSSPNPVSPLLTKEGNNQPTVMYSPTGQIINSYNINTGYDFFPQTPSGYVPYRMNNNKYFNLADINLNPSLSDPLKYHVFNFSIDQEIVHNLNANISYVNETVNNNFLNLFRTEYAVYSVDVNAKLPGGAPNPYVGQTYMQFRGLDNSQTDHNTNEVGRASLTYNLELNKINKWLGHYQITAFGESRKTVTEHLDYNNTDPTDPTNPESIGFRYYLSTPDVVATASPLQPGLVSGVPNIYFDSASGTYKNDTLTSAYVLKSDDRQLVKLKTVAAVAQAYLWDDRIVGLYGIRKDKNEAAFATSANGNGSSTNPAGPYGPTSTFTQNTESYGVVVHPLKWLSLHYNHSENFVPNAGSVDLLGNTTPSPTGVSEDYGFSVNLLDDKLTAKLNWFKITAAGAPAGNANFPLAQWTIPYLELTFMPDLARQAGITYKPLIAPGLVTGDPRLANAYTSDNVSKGLELEVTYNITKNWRFTGSISKQEAMQSNIASGLTAFIENRLAYWQSIPALWSGPYVGQNVGWGVGRTGQQQWLNDNNPYYIAYKSVDGQPSTQLAKWHASGLTNYTFIDGPMKGFWIGGGARYIDKQVIGNPNIYDSSGTAIALDLEHPYYANSYVSFDAWVGYKMKVYHDHYWLSFQLNGRDLEQSGGFRPIVANPDGSHAVYRIVQPRTFYLTTALEF